MLAFRALNVGADTQTSDSRLLVEQAVDLAMMGLEVRLAGAGREKASGRALLYEGATAWRRANLTLAARVRYNCIITVTRTLEEANLLMSQSPKGTYAFVSLGCPKNLVDSERMLGKLAQDGYALTPDADGADVVVINTCGFIEPARQESLGVIREMLALKQEGRVGAVVVAGCLAERKKDDLLNEVPDVDYIVGVFGREEITQVLDRTLTKRLQDEQRSLFRPAPVKALSDTERLRITGRGIMRI